MKHNVDLNNSRPRREGQVLWLLLVVRRGQQLNLMGRGSRSRIPAGAHHGEGRIYTALMRLKVSETESATDRESTAVLHLAFEVSDLTKRDQSMGASFSCRSLPAIR